MISRPDMPSKNAITIEQLKLACRHVQEMIDSGVTENLAIRTLELFADVYAKLIVVGNASPHQVDQVKLWSIKARELRKTKPDAKPKDCFRVEHGTPRRGFARKLRLLFQKDELTEATMVELVKRDYRLAVITLEEDQRLNKIARSKPFDTPEERWENADIKF
jgi:hypothetical protein